VAAAQRRRLARQPALGFAGLLLVVPIAVALAFAVDGPARSLVVLGPLVGFSLVPTAAVAFWWQDWPGDAWYSGWLNTVFIAALGVGLTFLGQVVIGSFDPRGVFDPNPPPGASPTFPAALPLAGAAFTAMLQFTLVCEGWPARRLPRLPAGVVAMAVAWGAALFVYYFATGLAPPPGSGLRPRTGPLPAASLGALLAVTGVWQVWFYVTWRGWPFRRIGRRWLRLLVANAVVVAGAWASFTLVHRAVSAPVITAGSGALIAAGLVVSMLFENAVRPHVPARVDRGLSVAVIAALATALFAVLTAYARTVDFGRGDPADWVTHACLNALAFSVILHVAVGRRWPFGD